MDAHYSRPRVLLARPNSRAKLDDERGFGLIELIMAMTIMTVALIALIGAFVAGEVSLGHSSDERTAGTIAEQQLELYRATNYCQIALTGDAAGNLTPTPASPYQSESAYSATQVTTQLADSWCTNQNPAQSPPYSTCLYTLGARPSPPLNACKPLQTVTGPDGRPYQVDTYITFGVGGTSPIAGGIGSTYLGSEVKQVTVDVRDGTTLHQLAREVSTFDPMTGS
jgi:prepilin-type N-terminal cleavage/methylation domain-containing protein